ncbi:alpha/beta hydrolase [Oscillatoria sp. FACHB-1406]|uniref:alpha/beta hydrolase n=1 Tax=Oscillatoria sp. FACHB-1406 TaxID=2692846 RepID=UPI0018F00E60|nr:alpha/beta hydrolase [Oscillatoria sp. FACHB-1406]
MTMAGFKGGSLGFSQRVGLGLTIAIASLFLTIPSAEAAERVVLKYNTLQGSVSVADLKALAERGEVSLPLRAYLMLARKNPEDLRRILNQEVSANPALLDRALNSFVGNFFLQRLGEVVQTPNAEENEQALRSALVTSAETDNRIVVMEILQNYPTEELHVNADRAIEIFQMLKGTLGRFSNLSL